LDPAIEDGALNRPAVARIGMKVQWSLSHRHNLTGIELRVFPRSIAGPVPTGIAQHATGAYLVVKRGVRMPMHPKQWRAGDCRAP
jgi:hypothetical protein